MKVKYLLLALMVMTVNLNWIQSVAAAPAPESVSILFNFLIHPLTICKL